MIECYTNSQFIGICLGLLLLFTIFGFILGYRLGKIKEGQQ